MNNKAIDIVGIGASAGGLEALQELFDSLSPTQGPAYVVIQHLSPDFKSLMKQLLRKNTRMQIEVIEQGMPILRNTVYLIPPKYNVTVEKGIFHLCEQPRDAVPRFPINIFFSSMAKYFGSHAIAIILSGTGSDGTQGMIDVINHHGLCIVQSPISAKFDGMPKSAIATKRIQFVVEIEQMGKIISSYINGEEYSNNFSVEEDVFYHRFIFEMREHADIDFSHYKKPMVVRRIERRKKLQGIFDNKEFEEWLKRSVENKELIKKELLINVTSFFRDKEVFLFLKENVFPSLIESHLKKKREFRVWVPACSSGEEAYSVAIIIYQLISMMGAILDVKIFATDICKESISKASAGLYSKESICDLDEDIRTEFFIEESPSLFRVKKKIRNMMVFSQHNLLEDPPFTKLSFLSCRNFLIYISTSSQRLVFENLKYALSLEGVLTLGPSESFPDDRSEFSTLNEKLKIFQKKRALPIKPILFEGNTIKNPLPKGNIGHEKEKKIEEIKASRNPSSRIDYQDILSSLVETGFVLDREKNIVCT